jgi:hypothetical protein
MVNALSMGGSVSLGDAAKTGVLTFSGAGTFLADTVVTAASHVLFTGALGGGRGEFYEVGKWGCDVGRCEHVHGRGDGWSWGSYVGGGQRGG